MVNGNSAGDARLQPDCDVLSVVLESTLARAEDHLRAHRDASAVGPACEAVGWKGRLRIRDDTRRLAAAVAGVWEMCGPALVSTLSSLAEHDVDGLNNIWQFPFASPWILRPIEPSSHVLNVWVAAVT